MIEESDPVKLDLVAIFCPARLPKTAQPFRILERDLRQISALVEHASDRSCVRWLQDPATFGHHGQSVVVTDARKLPVNLDLVAFLHPVRLSKTPRQFRILERDHHHVSHSSSKVKTDG